MIQNIEHLQRFSELRDILIIVDAEDTASCKCVIQNVRSIFRPISEIVENPVLILSQDSLNIFIRLTSVTQKQPSLKSNRPAQYNQHICSFYFYILNFFHNKAITVL